MDSSLWQWKVLALDAQASGASPAHGDLLELGWAACGADGVEGHTQTHWILPRSTRRVSRAVRELTGWSERCLEEALPEEEVWRALRASAAPLSVRDNGAPTVIHFARFELTFLHDLHRRIDPELPFGLDVVCLHDVAARLWPDLPRRNIRALAGFLGHSPELLRTASGHVAATAFIWRALIPKLAERDVRSWDELKLWLQSSKRPPRPTRARYPLEPARRRNLPDAPGVYRFLRQSGDVVYVGKAASLKSRVGSHFSGVARANERSLEMLTQVSDVQYTETPSVLEAALLECDEIKRLDPPYNVHLRTSERDTWFATRDLRDASRTADHEHRAGPLPSRLALAPLAALRALLGEGGEPAHLMAWALGVPPAFLPDVALFQRGFTAFCADHLAPHEGSAARRLDAAARSLWRARGRSEPEAPQDAEPDTWDLARVRRRLERNLIQAGLLRRRARWLCLLSDADVAYREAKQSSARSLTLSAGVITARSELARPLDLAAMPARRMRALSARQSDLDIGAYDRLRVLATELRRVLDEGGEVVVRLGCRLFAGDRLRALLRDV